MKKIIIKNNSGIIIGENQKEDHELQEFLDKLNSGNSPYGKPEHQRELTPRQVIHHVAVEARGPILAEDGTEISPEILAQEAFDEIIEATHELIPSEYLIEITDITSEIEQKRVNEEALKHLSETDWLITRYAETGIEIPVNIKLSRQAARNAIVR